MEDIDLVEMDVEPGTRSPRMTKDVKFTLDTHAMAYKLLLRDSGCEEREETSSEMISEYGKEARMDFYKNRSRSDGASAIMKSCLRELKERKAEDEMEQNEDSEETEQNRHKSSFSSANQRKLSVPSNLSSITAEPEEPKLEMPTRTYIPTVDSSEQLLDYGRNRPSSIDRQRLFAENRFVPYFTLPPPAFILYCLLDERKICLESFESKDAQLFGSIVIKRSPNPAWGDDRQRRIYARRTLDNWKTHTDIEAAFAGPSAQCANVDRYIFRLQFAPSELGAGTRLEFALAYEIRYSDGRVVAYWDNNNDANYAFWYSA